MDPLRAINLGAPAAVPTDMAQLANLEAQLLQQQALMQAAGQQPAEPVAYQLPEQQYTDAQGQQQSFQPLPVDPNAIFQTDLSAEGPGPTYGPLMGAMGGQAGFGAGTSMPSMVMGLGSPSMPMGGSLLQMGMASMQVTTGAMQGVSQQMQQMQQLFAMEQQLMAKEMEQGRQAGLLGWDAGYLMQFNTPQMTLQDLDQSAPVGERHGTGAYAVKLAERKLGMAACQVTMKSYHRAGGVTNDCADFVSACLADAGLFKKSREDASVARFEQNLIKQGYHPISKAQAQPGDVAIIQGNGISHTELVTKPGATEAIGANGTTYEQIRKDNLNWAGSNVVYYHRG